MSFTPKTFDQIYNQLQQSTEERLPGQVDFEVGSVVRTLYESFAYELALLYEQMDQVYRSAFIDLASGVQLEMVAAIVGIRRGLPDFAEGEVTFTRDPGSEDLVIPFGTLVTTEDSEESPRRAYTTLETVTFPAIATEITVKIQAVNHGDDQVVPAETITVMPLPVPGVKAVVNQSATQFLGKREETDDELRQRAKSMLLASGKASLTSIETALFSLPGVREVKVVESFQETAGYGVLDVYVDGTDMDRQERHDELRQCIDRVRAAGVYVRLQQPKIVELDGLIQIEADGSVASDSNLMNAVEEAIAEHLIAVSIGQPLLFPPLTQAILAVPGVSNLEDFALKPTSLPPDHLGRTEPFHSRDKRIDMASNATKFRLRSITVVPQVQTLPVGLSLKVSVTPAATPPVATTIAAILRPVFEALLPGQSLSQTEVHQTLQAELEDGITVEEIFLVPQSPSRFVQSTPTQLTPSFAEQLRLLESPIFIYQTTLDLVGAIKFIPDERATATERAHIAQQIRDRIDHYLNQRAPEQAINLDELWTTAQGDQVTLAPLNISDFQTLLADTTVDRVDPDTHRITVGPFEKAQSRYLLITDQTTAITLTLETLTVVVNPLPEIPPVPDPDPDTESETDTTPETETESPEAKLTRLTNLLKVELRAAINTFPVQPPGVNFNLSTLQDALLTLAQTRPELQDLPYRITELTLTATSAADNRTQTANLNTAPIVHIRSHERIRVFTAPTTITIHPPTP